MKSILYIVHGNNDLDHYMPIIFNAEKKYNCLIIFIPDRNSPKISYFHYNLLRKKKINIIYANNFFNSKIQKLIQSFILIIRSFKFKILNKTIFFYFFLILANLLEKLINFSLDEHSLKKSFENFLHQNKINLIIIDIIDQSKHDKNNLFKKQLGCLLHAVKGAKIPIFMISHGANILFDNKLKQRKKNNDLFYADSLALCNKYEKSLYKYLAKENNSIKILGDVRHDIPWMNFIKTHNINGIKKMRKFNNKLKLLYIMGNLNFLRDKNIEKKINSEISNLLSYIPNLEIWVKLHPKINSKFILEKEDIRIFHKETDTSILIQSADIIVTTHSGVIVESIISDKLNIFYDSWRKHTKNIWTIFDKTNCVKKINNFKNLCDEIKSFKKKKINDKDKNIFYKKFISGKISIKSSIVRNYLKEIDSLIKIKKYAYN